MFVQNAARPLAQYKHNWTQKRTSNTCATAAAIGCINSYVRISIPYLVLSSRSIKASMGRFWSCTLVEFHLSIKASRLRQIRLRRNCIKVPTLYVDSVTTDTSIAILYAFSHFIWLPCSRGANFFRVYP